MKASLFTKKKINQKLEIKYFKILFLEKIQLDLNPKI
jgi:hypothetical protein